ncbi:MAG TPA: cytochrome c [Novosphingobium sp.]
MRVRAGLGLAALFVAATAARPATPVPAPFFTAAQAAEGAQVYAQRCAMCHGRQLEGTFEVPALTGRFAANWAGRPLGDLSVYLGRAMPQFAPGTLAPEDNARLVAFILQANGYPAGDRPLPSGQEDLRRLVLPRPPAPR